MSNLSLPVLTGERVTLRRPRQEDFAARLALGTDAEIVRMYGGNRADARPMTEEAAKRWLQRSSANEDGTDWEPRGRAPRRRLAIRRSLWQQPIARGLARAAD
jgi:hypothetical protein